MRGISYRFVLEHVCPLPAEHSADKAAAAAVARLPHDLLDRRSSLGLFQDGGVGVLAPEVALVLDARRP